MKDTAKFRKLGSRGLFLIFLISPFPDSAAWANNPTSLPTMPVSGQTCDAYCNIFANWSVAACLDLGVQIGGTTQTSPPTPAIYPNPSASTGLSCTVDLSPSVLSALGSMGLGAVPKAGPVDGPTFTAWCNAAAQLQSTCNYAVTAPEVVTYCQAYNAIAAGPNSAEKLNYALLAMDTLALGLCTADCALSLAGAAGDKSAGACAAAGGAAGVFEIGATIYLSQSPLAQYLNSMSTVGTVFASLGGAGAVTSGLARFSGKGAKIESYLKSIGVETEAETNKYLAGLKKASPCISAATFAITLGVRAANLKQYQQTKNSACNSLIGLQSTSTPIPPGSGVAGGGGGSVAGVNNAPTSVANGGSTAPADLALQTLSCLANPTCASSLYAAAQAAAATGAGLLNSTVLGTTLPNAPSTLANALNAAPQGAAAISGALGGGANTPASNLLSQFGGLAQKAQELTLAGTPIPGIKTGAVYASSGARTAPPTASSEDFSNPFGKPEAAGSTAKSEELRFGAAGDIWHTGTSLSLFNIVSRRAQAAAIRARLY